MIQTDEVWNKLLLRLVGYNINPYYKVHVVESAGFQLRIRVDKNGDFESAEIRNAIGQPRKIDQDKIDLIIEVMNHKKELEDGRYK